MDTRKRIVIIKETTSFSQVPDFVSAASESLVPLKGALVAPAPIPRIVARRTCARVRENSRPRVRACARTHDGSCLRGKILSEPLPYAPFVRAHTHACRIG